MWPSCWFSHMAQSGHDDRNTIWVNGNVFATQTAGLSDSKHNKPLPRLFSLGAYRKMKCYGYAKNTDEFSD